MDLLPSISIIFLILSPSLADVDAGHVNFGYYARHIQDLSYDTLSHRVKRQDQSAERQDFYVTQCSHDNVEPTSGPSINVQGIRLQYPEATEQAARLIHLMVRFMPRSIFVKMASNSSVGLFPTSQLPTNLFDEFAVMPSICIGNCRSDVQTSEGVVDCSMWCTTASYPYYTDYPLAYLWAYGNFSRTWVAETNIVCQGFNPGNQENLLIREFGLTVMTRGLGGATLLELEEAYAASVQTNTWQGVKNVYHYFMMGTQAWFNGMTANNLGGMVCLVGGVGSDGCEDEYDQRQRLKSLDSQLYKILNYVYNNNRDYVNGDLSVCTW